MSVVLQVPEKLTESPDKLETNVQSIQYFSWHMLYM